MGSALKFGTNFDSRMHMKQLLDKHKIFTLVLAGVAGGVASLGGYMVVASNQATSIEAKQNASGQLARYASLNSNPAFDFTGVSEIANPCLLYTSDAADDREV